MISPAELDALIPLDLLVGPLPDPDNTAGVELDLRSRVGLTTARKLAVEGNLGAEDEDPLPPGHERLWRAVLDKARSILLEKSKSLEVVIRIVEAATKLGGMAGLRIGFTLLRRFTIEAWERSWPKLVDNGQSNLSARANFYNILDATEGAFFPATVRAIPVAEVGGVVVSAERHRPADPKVTPPLTPDELTSAAAKLGPEAVTEAAAAVNATIAELEALADAVLAQFRRVLAVEIVWHLPSPEGAKVARAEFQRKLDQLVPRFNNVRESLNEAKGVAGALVAALKPDLAPDQPPDPTPGTPAAVIDPTASGKQLSRESLYRQLTWVADNLARLEPHSPVPLLLRRVVELRDLSFPGLVQSLNADGKVLDFLARPVPTPKLPE